MREFKQFLTQDGNTLEARACNCVGPQDGNPVCPCRMPAHEQRQAERAAWEREQARLREGWEGL